MHVEMLLQLFRAHKAPITLITRPVLLLLPEHWKTNKKWGPGKKTQPLTPTTVVIICNGTQAIAAGLRNCADIQQSMHYVQRITFSFFFCNIVDLLIDKVCIGCCIPHLQKEIPWKTVSTTTYSYILYLMGPSDSPFRSGLSPSAPEKNIWLLNY